MKKPLIFLITLTLITSFASCKQKKSSNESAIDTMDTSTQKKPIQSKLHKYVKVDLTTDLEELTPDQKKMIPLLIKASQVMDSLYWYQTYGDLDSLINTLSNPRVKNFVKINAGPWDRLDNDKPFVKGVGDKPKGANFYPKEMTKKEFENADLTDKEGLYNFIRRDKEEGLTVIPYHEKFKMQLKHAADLLRKAADLAEEKDFAHYLQLRAKAMQTDQFHESDIAWMDMKDNSLGIVIGPIETYEDQLFGYKASYEAYVLHKDKAWSQRLAKYASFLPELQNNLPVDQKYKQEKPGADADINVYDVIYYGGAANAGGKTIAINLPNDEKVQLNRGTRRLQLKNAMRAKFDKILVPIADVLIASDQRKHVDFDAFFANTMFHEVAHGLGIKNTLDGKGTVRKALKEHASALEEGKADILGLYMVEQLLGKDELEGDIKDYYVTFIASIFRSVRFGAGDAHGVANMIRFNYFKEHHAFERLEDGTYRVNYDKMKKTVKELSQLILTLQGDGDYKAVSQLVKEKGRIGSSLSSDLNKLNEKEIPVDVVFKQGKAVLGLTD